VFYYQKKTRPAVSNCAVSADAPTEMPTLRSLLTFIERLACMLETISVQPTATLRQQSVHNEESYRISDLGPHNFTAWGRFQKMDPKTRRQALIQVGACTNCLSIAHKAENCGWPATCRDANGIIHCYTKDRLAIQYPAQQPLQATTILEDMLCSRRLKNHYKGQPVNYRNVAL